MSPFDAHHAVAAIRLLMMFTKLYRA